MLRGSFFIIPSGWDRYQLSLLWKNEGFSLFLRIIASYNRKILLCVMTFKNVFQAITIWNQVKLILYVEMRRCFVITRLKLSTVATNSWNIKMLITPWFLNEVALNSIFGFELYRKKQAFLFSFQTYITRNSFKDVQGFSSFIF